MKGAECWSHSSKQPQQEEVTGRYVQSDIVTHTCGHTYNPTQPATKAHTQSPPQSHRCRVSHTYLYKYCHTQSYIVTHPAIPWHGLTYVDSQTHKNYIQPEKNSHKPHSYITNPHPQETTHSQVTDRHPSHIYPHMIIDEISLPQVYSPHRHTHGHTHLITNTTSHVQVHFYYLNTLGVVYASCEAIESSWGFTVWQARRGHCWRSKTKGSFTEAEV